jgi:hypothetical protein
MEITVELPGKISTTQSATDIMAGDICDELLP